MHTNPSSPHILKRCHSLPARQGGREVATAVVEEPKWRGEENTF